MEQSPFLCETRMLMRGEDTAAASAKARVYTCTCMKAKVLVRALPVPPFLTSLTLSLRPLLRFLKTCFT
jgi:hypothetical protein